MIPGLRGLDLTEAQLRLLQAQIEPHFLFNTLANVQSLIDHDTPRAKAMLESFTDYLRASLGQRMLRMTLGRGVQHVLRPRGRRHLEIRADEITEDFHATEFN